MRIYHTSNLSAAKNIRHLMILNSECVSLKWSRYFNDTSESVSDALNVIIDYIERKIPEICGQCDCELTDEEEQAVLQIIKTKSILQNSLGSGVVLAGNESDLVYKHVQNELFFSKIQHILEAGDSLVLF